MIELKESYPTRTRGTSSERQKAYMRQYYAKNRDKKVQYAREHRDWMRDRQYRKRYSLTLAEVERLKERPCAICGAKSQAIDHDHISKKVRGVLCHKCNTGLGMFRDSPWIMRSAANYIEGL